MRTKTEGQLAPLREQLNTKHKELAGLWSADAPNRAAILKADSELDALRQKMRQIGIDHRLGNLALLTPEQRIAWKQRHAGGMGRGPGIGHGGMRDGVAGLDMGR